MRLKFLLDDDEGESNLKHTNISRPNKLSGRYGCMITFQTGETKNEIRYKLNIEHSKKYSENNIFKIDRAKEIFINDLPPNSFLDQLAVETSHVLYPLELEILNDNSIKSVRNFNEIKERWVEVEKKIREYYKGKLTDKYLKIINAKALSSEEKLISKLSKDWFLYMYFILFNKSTFNEKSMQFPTAGKALPINYNITQKVKEQIKSNTILVNINGEINDKRCALDLEQELDYPYFRDMDKNEKDLKGICDITYFINKKTKIIEGIKATFDTKYLEPKKVIVKMFLLENNTIKESDFLDL